MQAKGERFLLRTVLLCHIGFETERRCELDLVNPMLNYYKDL